MSLPHIEKLGESLPEVRLPPLPKLIRDALLEIADKQLEQSNWDRAEEVALFVRERGIYNPDIVRTVWSGKALGYRPVILTTSIDTLKIHFAPTEISPYSDHVVYNRSGKIEKLNAYDFIHNQPMIIYRYDQGENNVPQTITPWHVSQSFADVLDQVEQVIR